VNNVMNRKMFRPRNARNKLNQMGGIMASSAPLMQSVQRFSNGTQVNVRSGPSTISKFGQVMSPTGYGVSSSFPYQRTTAPMQNPAVQSAINRNIQAQRALNAGIADMPATGLVKQDPESQGFFNRLYRDVAQPVGSAVADFFAPDDPKERVNQSNLRGILGLDPVGVAQPKVREGIQTITEDVPPEFGVKPTMTSLQEAEIATQGSDQLVPTQQPLSRMGTDEEDVFTEDVGSLSILGDRDLAQAGADEEDAFTEEGEVSRADDVFDGADADDAVIPTTTAKKDKGITEQVNPAATSASVAVAKVNPTSKKSVQESSQFVGNLIMEAIQKGDVDGAEEVAASALGADEAASSGAKSTEDRIKRQRDIIAKVMGVDPEQYKQDRGMAIANFGFALMNKSIGEAGQQLVADLKANNAAQQAREDKINSTAISTVLGREEKEADRQFTRDMKRVDQAHDWRKLETVEGNKLTRLTADMNFRGYMNDVNNTLKLNLKDKDIEMFNARLSNDAKMLADRIASAEKIASDNNLSQNARNQATIDASNARAVLSGLGDGTKLALIEGQQKGFTGTELNDFVSKRSKELATESTLTGPDSLRRMITTVAPQIMKEEDIGFDEAVQKILDSNEIQQFFSADLEALGITRESSSTRVSVTKDPNNLSEAELKNMWDSGARSIEYDGKIYPLENPGG